MVILSTVHKAKGLEEERIFILKPDLMPHPKARMGWQLEQEYNLKYVAYSRAKAELFFVQENVPANLSNSPSGNQSPHHRFRKAATPSLEQETSTSKAAL